MPIYTFHCSQCGAFDKRTPYTPGEVLCPTCSLPTQRQEVYKQSTIMAGRSLPSASDTEYVAEELGKDLKKKGWDGSRAIEEMRKNRFEDKTGGLSIDTTKIAKTA